MTPDNIIVLVILVAAIILFASEKLRADVVALLVLLALYLTRLLTIEEAFLGFSSPAVVTVWAVFIISGGLQRTGVADLIARQLLRLVGQSERRLLLFLMIGAGVMSAFMNNIGAVAILMPAVISIGRKLKISSSKLLMPLAFAALLGGNMTLIGTPPNILAADIMTDFGLEPFSFFDFAPTGILVLAVGVIYMMTIGRRLLPERIAPGGLSQEYAVREFVTEVQITSGSSLIGRKVKETNLGADYDLNVVYVNPHQQEFKSPLGDHVLQEDDVMLLEGSTQAIINARETYRLRPTTDFRAEDWSAENQSDDFHLAEVTLGPNSELQDKTLRQINFRDRYGLSVLAARHDGVEQISSLGNLVVKLGDSLLVQGPLERFESLINDDDLLVLERPTIQRRRTQKIPLASVVLLAVVVTAATGLLHVSALMLAGALLMVLGGALKMDEAYRAIDWKAIFLIAGMLPLGTAMEKTGTAQLIADQLAGLTGDLGPVVVLGTIFVLTGLLTEVISNAAAAVLVVPISIDVAFGLGLNAQPFVMGTVIAASTSFLMPIGHQVNIIIYGAGGYKFFDYARVGVGLNILLLLFVMFVVPLIWPF